MEIRKIGIGSRINEKRSGMKNIITSKEFAVSPISYLHQPALAHNDQDMRRARFRKPDFNIQIKSRFAKARMCRGPASKRAGPSARAAKQPVCAISVVMRRQRILFLIAGLV